MINYIPTGLNVQNVNDPQSSELEMNHNITQMDDDSACAVLVTATEHWKQLSYPKMRLQHKTRGHRHLFYTLVHSVLTQQTDN